LKQLSFFISQEKNTKKLVNNEIKKSDYWVCANIFINDYLTEIQSLMQGSVQTTTSGFPI